MHRSPWRRWPHSGPVGCGVGLCLVSPARSGWSGATLEHGPGLSHLPAGDHALVASFRRPRPYLFTPDPISALIQDARKVGPRGALRPHTFSTLIGLLASTGLRVGEARRLLITDVWLDHAPSCLHIRDTKFHKSRLVPLHPSTAEHLRHYARLRTALHYDGLSDAFFVSEQGGPLSRRTLWHWFTARCRALGLGPTAGGR